MTVLFDKLDYHLDGALQAGGTEDHAFTHIGLFLAWLVRRDLHDPEIIREEWADAIRADEMTGSDLAGAIDGKLASDLMTSEGAAFTAANYEGYLADYARVFEPEGDYRVDDSIDAFARIAPLLDARYERWIAEGRPTPIASGEDSNAADRQEAGATDEAHVDLAEFREAMAAMGWTVTVVGPDTPKHLPHEAEDLERLIPADMTQPPMETSSYGASWFNDPLQRRALKRLGVAAADCRGAYAIGGVGDGVLTVTIHAVPARRDDLEREFAVVLQPPRGRWTARTMAGRTVHWAESREACVAYWGRDGLLIYASAASSARLEQLVARLP